MKVAAAVMLLAAMNPVARVALKAGKMAGVAVPVAVKVGAMNAMAAVTADGVVVAAAANVRRKASASVSMPKARPSRPARMPAPCKQQCKGRARIRCERNPYQTVPSAMRSAADGVSAVAGVAAAVASRAATTMRNRAQWTNAANRGQKDAMNAGQSATVARTPPPEAALPMVK